MSCRKIKNKINAYIYCNKGINKCINTLYNNLNVICECHCGGKKLKNKKFQKK